MAQSSRLDKLKLELSANTKMVVDANQNKHFLLLQVLGIEIWKVIANATTYLF
jgi:hypothetical protein